eukprot:gene5660-6846_t
MRSSVHVTAILAWALLLIPLAGADWGWTTTGSPTQKNLYSLSTVRFVDGWPEANVDYLWTVGTWDTILKSTDRGQTWEVQTTGSGAAQTWYGVSFRNQFEGWIVGSSAKVMHTVDGGATWSSQTTPITDTSIEFTAVASAATCNEGDTLCVYSLYVVGRRGTILFSQDSGATFIMQDSGTTADLLSVHFVDHRTGWISGDLAVLLYTATSGEPWTRQPPPPDILQSSSISDLTFVNRSFGLGTGEGFIVRTVDGGASWHSVLPCSYTPLRAVAIDQREAWTVGDSGLVCWSEDYGLSWRTQ